MHLRPLLLLVLTIVFAGSKGCDVDIGNIGDFLVTYDIAYTNAGSEPALLYFIGKDVKRKAIVAPGGTLHATSFAGGSLLLGASPSTDYLALLKAERDKVAKDLDAVPRDLSKMLEVQGRLNTIYAQIRDYESKSHGGLCAVELKPSAGGKGRSVAGTATFDGDRWQVACS